MTAERIAEIEFEVHPEELSRLLAAPDQKDPREVADPIALACVRPLA
jgi:hypothetical protein